MKLLPLYLLLLILISSCCKKEDAVYHVNTSLIEAIPYQNGQVVKFKGLNGDSLTFTATRNTKRYERESDNCTDCCDGYSIYQENFFISLFDTVYPQLDNGVFEIYIGSISEDDTTIRVSMKREGFDILWTEYMEFYISNNGDFICRDGVFCHDSIQIGNSVYHNVIEVINLGYYPELNSTIHKFYYSIEKGILKIDCGLYEEFVLQE